MFRIWIAVLLYFGTSTGNEVCYERVGCFRDGLPWTGTLSRQFAGLPWSPEEINTRFLLYTRRNPKVYQEISAVNPLTIQASYFGTDKMTHINIPGWKTDGKWQQDMCNKEFGYSPSKVHLIGHSVGAHLAGEAGSRIPGLGRITGAGTINACGHLDFYPNGGKHMPGCEDLITPLFKFDFSAYKEEVASFFDCNHARSHRFYTESILNPDAFIAYPCRSYKAFKAGNCFHCPQEGCPTMGHFADRFHLKNMKPNRPYYFLNTGTLSPFARWRHKLSVKLSGNNVTQGSIFLHVGGTTGEKEEFVVASGTLKPGMTYTKLIDADINVGNITSIASTFCSQDITGPNIAYILKPC
ncbi:hypothetical protein MC885_009278 [Smutsia gigantea]|nr:hypothetical protein MC885_009278 [Smutsia gigantea]